MGGIMGFGRILIWGAVRIFGLIDWSAVVGGVPARNRCGAGAVGRRCGCGGSLVRSVWSERV